MNFFTRLFRLAWSVLWYTFAVLTVLMAATFGLARLLLPMAEQYSADVEQQASEFAGQPVKVRSLDAEWHGFGPSLVLKGVRVLDSNSKDTIMQFSRARLGLDLFSSMLQQQINFTSLTLIGADLSFVRHSDGHISLSDFNLKNDIDASKELADDTFISKWLLGQGLLSLEVKNLLFEDRMNKNRLFHFSNASVMLRNSGDLHFMDAVLSLPDDPKHKLTTSVKVEGNPFEGGDWQADFYMAGRHVNFKKLMGVQNVASRLASLGDSDFEFWGQWSDSRLQSLRGEFAVQDALLSMKPDEGGARNPSESVRLHELSTRFHWQRQGTGWKISGDKLIVSRAGRKWPSTEYEVEYFVDPQKKQQIKASSSFIRIDDVLALRPLARINDTFITETLQSLKPSGDLHNASVAWREDNPEAFFVRAKLHRASVEAWDKFPGIQHASGTLALTHSAGKIEFDTNNASYFMPTLFRHRQAINKLEGTVKWSLDDDVWSIKTEKLKLDTPDISSRLFLDLQIPNSDQSPFMTLIVDFENGDGSQVSKYLPVKIMTDDTVNWLDNAIVDATVTTGGVLFHGATQDFPFYKNQGVFEVRFNVENGTLKYVDDWPAIENINAEVVFRDEGMHITSDSASIFRSALSSVSVDIPDLGAKLVKLGIKGNVSGETSEKIWYVQSSPPLANSFGHYFDDFTVRGNSDLSLDIGIDLGDELDSNVSGKLTFNDNDIDIKSLGSVFTNANGQLNIEPDSLTAPELSVDLFGQPTKVGIRTVPARNNVPGSEIEVFGEGDFDARDLSHRYAKPLAELVEGKAPWAVVVSIPYQQTGPAASTEVNVAIDTNLEGVALNLPAPFHKDKKTEVSVQAGLVLQAEQHSILNVSMGDLFNSVIALEQNKQHLNYRGEIRFGGGPVKLPDLTGIQLNGHLPELNTDVWRNLVSQISADSKTGRKTDTAFDPRMNCCSWMRSADLTISNMVAYGQSISRMELTATNDGKTVSLNLDSKELAGNALIPGNLQRFPIELDLDYWHLIEAESAGEGDIDPRDIPAIKAFSKLVTYKNRKFGSVRLETTRLAEGLRLEQLVVKPRATTITAHGKWVIEGSKQKSDFALQLISTDLGLTLDDFDYAGSISGGAGTINASTSWQGSLTALAPEHLQGNVELSFQDGNLLEVEAGGAGRRIFGLFSLRTLPRRLLLDFTDLFDKGFKFDSIKGNFNITQGDAYTKNFTLSGPGVDAEMSGRIGIASQDYDQQVKITPHVSDVTSLLTLLSSEPLLFLLQQILKDKINQAASFAYHLSGPWDNYVLEPINPPELEIFEDDELTEG